MRGRDVYPCPWDKTKETSFDRHYIYHTAWAARKLAEIKPKRHIDVGSSLYFAGIVSAFIPFDFYDLRPADLVLDNFQSHPGDLGRLPLADASVESLSCLHVIEHIGLGRYGDKIDPQGDWKSAQELTRVLAPGGNLLIAVPVGRPRIQFNAHRVYSPAIVLDMFNGLVLKEFTLIPEKGGSPITKMGPETADQEKFACGCFWFVKE